jgi:hypothetical protein
LIGAEEFLLLISATLFLCHVSGLIYTKMRIPDILILLGFWVLQRPLLGFFQKETFVAISPLISVVALLLVIRYIVAILTGSLMGFTLEQKVI